MSCIQPLVFDIRRFAREDGPGIRTTVFLKGCPLDCLWCHNPEGIGPTPERMFQGELCVGCDDCALRCRHGAILIGGNERFNPLRCVACGACAEVCQTQAVQTSGQYYPPEELVELLMRDREFYAASEGGVTFSGGEPTLHAEYLHQVLIELKKQGVHTALQTCGHFNFNDFCKQLLPYLDLICFDLKLANPDQHLLFTGRENTLIRNNFLRLSVKARGRLVPRVPLVPGITATEQNLAQIATLLREAGFSRCELLPYTPDGLAKRRNLSGTVSPALPEAMLSREEEEHWKQFMQRQLDES